MLLVQDRGYFSVGQKCHVLAMIYLMRAMASGSLIQMTGNNWDLLLLCAYLVSGKFWDDTPLLNCEFLHLLYPGREQYVTKHLLNKMESTFLNALSFDLVITRDAYTLSYFELVDLASTAEQSTQRNSIRKRISASRGAGLGLDHELGELRCGSLLSHAQRERTRRGSLAMSDTQLPRPLGPRATAVVS